MRIKNIAILVALASIILISGCVDNITKSPKEQAKEDTQKSFEECNYRCGEGFGNSICKASCTYDYNNRLEEIEQQYPN